MEKNSSVPLTTRFMKGKMLMFTKTSLQNFIYYLIDVFCFPDETVQKIYEKYIIENCFLYENLTDTDSTSLFFVFICNIDFVLNENESRNILFEVMVQSKIIERLDLSEIFGKILMYRTRNLRNKSVSTKSRILKTQTL